MGISGRTMVKRDKHVSVVGSREPNDTQLDVDLVRGLLVEFGDDLDAVNSPDLRVLPVRNKINEIEGWYLRDYIGEIEEMIESEVSERERS